jgi:hypothetical protein
MVNRHGWQRLRPGMIQVFFFRPMLRGLFTETLGLWLVVFELFCFKPCTQALLVVLHSILDTRKIR